MMFTFAAFEPNIMRNMNEKQPLANNHISVDCVVAGFDGEQLKSIHGEGMTSYLNRHLHTNINGMAGMNQRYGRSKALDKLAHRFMNTVWSERRRGEA